MQVFDFRVEIYCGDFKKQMIRGRDYLVASTSNVKKRKVNAFSGEEGELLGRIFCNIDCSNDNQIEEFYQKYGHIGRVTLESASEIVVPFEHVLSYQRDIHNALTLSAAIENPRTTDEYTQMLSTMLYFLLFNEGSLKRPVILKNIRKTGIWALQRRFMGKLWQKESVGAALYALLQEYDWLQSGGSLDINDIDSGSIEGWISFMNDPLCEDICSFLEVLYSELYEGKECRTEAIRYDETSGLVTLTEWPDDINLKEVHILAKKILCNILNRSMQDIRWDVTLKEDGTFQRSIVLPDLYSLMMAELSQKIIDKKSVEPIECKREGCSNKFSKYIHAKKKYCSVQCKNQVASQNFRDKHGSQKKTK